MNRDGPSKQPHLRHGAAAGLDKTKEMVEQNFPMVLTLSDYIYILNKGTIVYGSAPIDLKDNDDVKTKYLSVAR